MDVWHASRSKRFQVWLIVAIFYPIIAVLARTIRWRVAGLEHLDAARAGGRAPILGFWHGRILPSMYYFRDQGIIVITSQNFDGEWIARIITKFGFGTARGSSSRRAIGALRELIRAIRSGRGVAFTLDGPRGPFRQAKAGAVWLASATGSPIVPFHVEVDRAWHFASWDRSLVPKPFSTATIAFAEPLEVPRGLDEAGIETFRLALEDRLADAVRRAETLSATRG
jgi:lysophospholipid acyltransferase (LPLAT)-like uncharacterized protein